MARSLSQMLLAGGGQPGGGTNVFTQAQRGIQTGLQLARAVEGIDAQRAQAKTQRFQAETAKLNFHNKGIDSIITATTPAIAKRKGKLYFNSSKNAKSPISEGFIAELIEQPERAFEMKADVEFILANPSLSAKQKSALTQDLFKKFAEENGFREVSLVAKQVRQALEKQTARKETREARREARETRAEVTLSKSLVKAQTDFEKKVENERRRLEGVSTIKALLESGGPISQNVAQFQLARLAQGAGVLTDKDITRLGGSRAIRNRVESAVRTAVEGKPLTPADTAELLKIVNLFDTRLNEQVRTKASSFARGRSKALRETEARILEVLDIVPPTQELADTVPPTGPLDVEAFIKSKNLSTEQAQAFRQAIQPPVAAQEPPQRSRGPIPAQLTQSPELPGR